MAGVVGVLVADWVGVAVGVADVVVGLGVGLTEVGVVLGEGDAEALVVVRVAEGEGVGEADDIDGNGCGAGTLSLVNIPHTIPTTRPTTATIATMPQIRPARDRGAGAPPASKPVSETSADGVGTGGRTAVAPSSARLGAGKSSATVLSDTGGKAVVA